MNGDTEELIYGSVSPLVHPAFFTFLRALQNLFVNKNYDSDSEDENEISGMANQLTHLPDVEQTLLMLLNGLNFLWWFAKKAAKIVAAYLPVEFKIFLY